MSTMTGGADNGAHGELVPAGAPATLRWNMWATAVWCAFSVLSSLVLFGERPYLRKSLKQQNAKAKKPIADYTTAKINHDVHTQLVGGLIESLLVALILLLLAGLAWRGRRWARWVLLALAVIGLPLRVGVLAQFVLGVVPSSAPGLYRAALVVAGLVSLLVCVLLLLRPTRQYFAALRQTQRGNLPPVPGARVRGTRPTGPARAGSVAGGGLGALLGLRRRPAAGARPTPFAGATATGLPAFTANAADAAADNSADTAVDDAAADNAAADNAVADNAAAVSASAASRRPTATRPGQVKAKGSGTRPARFKSRQQ